jgi:hypothetical protein
MDHLDAARNLQERLGFESLIAAEASLMRAVSALMLDDPRTALDPADRYRRSSSPFAPTGEGITALARMALGDLGEATAAAREHALIAATGRIITLPADSLLVLAVLAKTERDPETATELLLNVGVLVHGGLGAFAERFAQSLGIDEDVKVTPKTSRFAHSGALRTRAATSLAVLRKELTRRGWS